ncbi:YccF domain-containing protein [Pseudonocardia sichuanensis]|uniref:Uncharacterized membrane protein YccF (DUF307 family) n=1 Tax=Pseudonocardia kunmingensis TaxID=630975 RepID=A0A543DJ94_9PSEU|nr:YccF domain-containing protein [Pseudonocardia kunmingensis]TQM09399.1 uncharacterized membrane protein YccF (DUF307 family) [Pseudonocardia kunmingensis]
MRFLGNVLWLVLAGWWLALAYVVAGVLACVLIVTIPFGIASFRLAGFALWPFGRRVVVARDAGLMSVIGNVIWIVLFGWQLAVLHVVAGLLLMITIVGIPFGIASVKLGALALVPLGTRVVDADDAWVPQYERQPAY